jgi:drug/metabolite transporter (DMT)-like permease
VGKESLSTTVALVHRARVLLIGTTVLWGLSFPLLRGLELAQRAAVPHISDAALAAGDVALRFGFATIFLLPIYGAGLRSITGREWSQAAGLAVFALGGLYLQTLGLAWTDASITAFLTQLYSLLVPLIVSIRDGRFPTARVLVACVMVLAGAALLSPGLLRHFILGTGELVIILSTFFMACQIVWVERPMYAKNRAGVVTLLMFAMMTGFSAVGYAAVGGTTHFAAQMLGTPALWTLTLALVLLCTVFNFLIMNAWQRRVSATEAGLIYCIEPVIAAILSAFLPGLISRMTGISYENETLGWTLLVGGFLIVIATVLVATEKRPNAPA